MVETITLILTIAALLALDFGSIMSGTDARQTTDDRPRSTPLSSTEADR
jgi:hypothetical protein